MPYDFLAETYETERLKTLAVWSLFRDDDLPFRPHPADRRGRSVREQMVHQCVSENLWFVKMLGLNVGAPPLPEREERPLFLRRYAEDSGLRSAALRGRDAAWWEGEVPFFDVHRSRAWIVVRRIAHTAHHRGQLTAMLRQLGRDLYSTYGPSADTGGLAVHSAPTVYAYDGEEALLADLEAAGEAPHRNPLPPPGERPVTERPEE